MAAPQPKLRQIPPNVASAADYEPLARERLTDPVWAYLSGGATDELTLNENIAAYRRLRLRSRVLEDMSGANTALTLFGQSFECPILLAPVAHQRLFHPDGEQAAVLGATAAGAGCVISTLSNYSLEEIAEQSGTPLWFQLYIQPDREFTLSLVRRAEAAGFAALVVTVDAPVNGLRNREQRAGFMLPPDIEPVNLRGMHFPTTTSADGTILLGGPLLAAAPTWRDIAWLRSQTQIPLLLKGIMTAEEAIRARNEGADGIVVSNHGGRTLDTLPAAIDALPEVVAAVGGYMPILIDGGIRRGTDIFKALALGASAVLLGRPYVYGLAAAGAVGVAHVTRIMRAELEVAMALTGRRDLSSIGASQIIRPGY